METPAGWYDDGSGRQRWWDGQQWTDQYADAQAPTAAPAEPAVNAGATAPAGYAIPEVLTTAPTGAPGSTAPAAVKPNVVGIIGLVAAALGFVFACIPGALVIGWVLLPIGLILSVVSFFLKGRKWPGIVGLIVAIIGTIVGFVVFFVVVLAAANEAIKSLPSIPEATNGAVATNAATPAPAASNPADAKGSFAVTIDDATQSQDYEGKPVIVVTYTFTNNSSKDGSFLSTVRNQAFQDGVELDTAIVADGSVDTSSAMKQIKPGASITVQWAFALTSKSDVEVELSNFLDFSDKPVVTKTFTVS